MYATLHGKQVFATTGGKPLDKDKPCVIFLHGSGLDHSFWAQYSRYFAYRNYSVLAPDLPGHTYSEGPVLRTIEAMADWLDELVCLLELQNLSIVGHSQGSLVALEFAARYPTAVRSLSLIASGLAIPVNRKLIDAADSDPESAITMMLSWGYGPRVHEDQDTIPGNSMLAEGRKILQRNAPDALAADLAACNNYQGGEQSAAQIRCPVQVVLASQDRMTPQSAGMALVDRLADAEVHIIAESGHMLPQEVPDRCRHLLAEYICANNPSA